jgi:cysteinyl-tRNA synthetase
MFTLFSRASAGTALPISFYDGVQQAIVPFTPLQARKVTMYSCGPTVYDHIHIGNLRAYLLPDLVKRVLQYNGYDVRHTINFTDFGHLSDDGDAGEDKMMKGMRREGYPLTLEAMRDFSEPYIESFKRDMERFGNLPPTNYTRASDYVKEQITLIETLYEKGYAYETTDGVYFDVEKFPRYGALGNLNLENMRAGARVAVNEEKRHPADFALWKKGALGWKSRWGTGFPGWHIECTAMAFATLGKTIDIHTGGEDLAYTHHNGEIAQAECATGKPYVRYWLHNRHVTINDEKIAKSAGNGITLQALIDQGFEPEDYRYWLLQSHYRSTANFSIEALHAARTALLRLKRYVYEELGEQPVRSPDERYEEKFATLVNHDLDTPQAIALLWELVKDTSVAPDRKLATIQVMDSIFNLGLSQSRTQGLLALGQLTARELPDDIQALLEERDLARAAQNWPESDRIREQLSHAGYEVTDTKDGTRVARKP